MSDVTVRRITPAEMAEASRIVGLAFALNPSNLAIAGGNRDKAARIMEHAALTLKLGNSASHVLVAERKGELAGVLKAAQWPHCQMTVGEKIKSIPSQVRTIGLGLPRALKVVGGRAKHEPRRPHWHLGPIAVHPEHQGYGIGSAMLTAFLADVDRQKVPAFLQADVDRNVVLYERFGFQVVSQEAILGINTCFMWRDAR
ncbi:GNAT family N-acetyltransferase [Micromonospora andamanensis]|uniref:Acetyltransferase n=1 Tax=Micromonospora andamanensis TaxID=1287068 RepID=A0ABQ4HW33_9ACTN|nr:GNAT family N-acetyltransferase [Micromonospora andamanensis]GIJ09841.1 putative acetyltransferase [Micromonospora andamanensis]GIJ38390.1 putative acetyltransferase [Micromonospora andamanensis]